MPKATNKRNSKQTSTTLHQASKSSKPPPPFSLPPGSLLPFLKTLDSDKVYITHIDTLPWAFKRRIFAVPVLLNVAIIVLIVYRLYRVVPTYTLILLSTMGVQNAATINFDSLSWSQFFWLSSQRGLLFIIDYMLYEFIYSWPVDFFGGVPSSPAKWRWRVGFQDKEIIVRVSRKWHAELDKELITGNNDKAFQEKIMPAIDRQYMHEKTGYLLMDKNWELDFQSMITATEMVNDGGVKLDNFEKTVVVHTKDFGWLIWPVHRLDRGSDDEGRKKIVAFKDKLTAMGKESVFFRWIELIQYESTQPGGFTPERQASAMRQAKEIFENQEINFEMFWREIGGMEGMPGMELRS
ncbi:MAG: hypothetical protein M1835_007201 [Candelina submexicana]|nr:MAG: hypothetical protein M1835_007201 [Candelina submexicana]